MRVRELAKMATLAHFGLEKLANRQQLMQSLRQALRPHLSGIATGAGLGAGTGYVIGGETADPTKSFEQHMARRLKGALIGGAIGGITGGLGSKALQTVNPALFQKFQEGPFADAPERFRRSRAGDTAAARAARMMESGVQAEHLPPGLLEAIETEKKIYGKTLPLEYAAQLGFKAYMHPATRLGLGYAAGNAIAGSYADSVAHHRLAQMAAIKAQNESDEKNQHLNARLEAMKAYRHMGEYRSSLDRR